MIALVELERSEPSVAVIARFDMPLKETIVMDAKIAITTITIKSSTIVKPFSLFRLDIFLFDSGVGVSMSNYVA